MRCLQNILLAVSGVLCLVTAASTFTLPNGKILEDPYVMSQRPDGLEIGYKSGIVFVKFTDLPESVKKKYNYDPAKAAEYEARQQEYKEKQRIEKEKRDAEVAAARAENQKIMLNWQINQLDLEIQKTGERIKFLKDEIPRLDREYENCLDKSAEMAGKSTSPNYGNNTYSYGWNGGFITTGGSNYTDSARRQVISKLGDNASNAKAKADNYRDELEKKQFDLIVMKKDYAALKAQQQPDRK